MMPSNRGRSKERKRGTLASCMGLGLGLGLGLGSGVNLAHAVVVVVLLRELLRAQLVHLYHLLRQGPRLEEPLSVEHDLGDEGVVGHHHRDAAEERLEVVRQLGAAGVAGVHRDEGARCGLEPDLAPLEYEVLHVGHDGDAHGPAAALHDAAEELAHHLVVELVGAVEDDALAADTLGEVLDALRLARARGAGGRAAQPHVQRAGDRHPAAVGERRDDETAEHALVLVTVLCGGVDLVRVRGVGLGVGVGVGCGGVDLPHDAVVLCFVPVEAQLHLPREGAHGVHLLLGHQRHDVAVVHVARHQRHEGATLELTQLARHLVGRGVRSRARGS
eukprot:scaffold36045_cov47-Phaeocystis_antarctica.AAC.1